MNNKLAFTIKSMMYDTPTDYKESRKYYTDALQEKINETSEFASSNYETEQELVFGTFEFEQIVCRVNHAIEPKTGLNLGDDFKELRFLDLNSTHIMGKRFRFNNSVWITVNTDNYRYITKSCIVRRCNNEFRYIDEKGKIISEPCIIEYDMKYSNIYYNKAVNVPQGTIDIYAQNNANSAKIKINDRFIFGSQVFKVKTVNDFLRSETLVKDSAPMIRFETYIDSEADDDDFDLQIANMDKYKNVYPPEPEPVGTEVVVTPMPYTVYEKETQEFECFLYIDGAKQLDEFTFTPSGVSAQYYTLTTISPNHFSVTNHKMYIDNPLSVLCSTPNGEKTISVLLRGLF